MKITIMKLKRFIVKSEEHLHDGHRSRFDKFMWRFGKWFMVIAPIMLFYLMPSSQSPHRNIEMNDIVGIIVIGLLVLAVWLMCLFYCIIDILKIYLCIRSISYTHKEFCEFIKFFRKDKKELPKWQTYPMYIFSFPFWWMFLLMMIMTVVGMVNSSKNKNEKYPSDKYKKVIKKGILWDNIEYHERCCIGCSPNEAKTNGA